ncbi:unnamed protein product [Lampetra planeri]
MPRVESDSSGVLAPVSSLDLWRDIASLTAGRHEKWRNSLGSSAPPSRVEDGDRDPVGPGTEAGRRPAEWRPQPGTATHWRRRTKRLGALPGLVRGLKQQEQQQQEEELLEEEEFIEQQQLKKKKTLQQQQQQGQDLGQQQ